MKEIQNQDDHLEFLRDEGLEILSLFRQIRDKERRALILDLIRALVESQSPTNGDGQTKKMN